jgi:glucose-6-phosphate isomerase
MKKITVDFNNMFASSVGPKHGVTPADLRSIAPAVKRAHTHIQKMLREDTTRINVSFEWTQLPYQDRASIRQIQRLGNEIARKYIHVLSLGIGGSYLGLKAAQDALLSPYYNEFDSVRKGRPRIYFEGNNIDPTTLRVLLKNLDPKKTFVIVISKSGETTETKAAFDVVEPWLKDSIGKTYGRQIFAITDPKSGTLREKVNKAHSADPRAFRNLPVLKGVGGRYSEFNIGLLHLAITGIDIQAALDGAAAMAQRCAGADIFKNPAYMYATLHYILYKRSKKSIGIMMPFSEGLRSTADWYCQLLAESHGKKYKRKIVPAADGSEVWENDLSKLNERGRTPIASRGTNDLHSIQQNNVEGENNKTVTFIRVRQFDPDIKVPSKKDLLSGRSYTELMTVAQEATEWALARAERPSCTITLPRMNAYHWGELLYLLEMATAFEGELMNINSFDQPGVEGYKNYMYYKLKKPGISQEVIRQIRSNPLKKEARYII